MSVIFTVIIRFQIAFVENESKLLNNFFFCFFFIIDRFVKLCEIKPMRFVCDVAQHILLEAMNHGQPEIFIVFIQKFEGCQQNNLGKENWYFLVHVKFESFVDRQPFMLCKFWLIEVQVFIDIVLVAEIKVKLCIICWEKSNWWAKSCKRNKFLDWWINLFISAKLDEIRLKILYVLISELCLSLLVFLAMSKKNIALLKKFSESCHSLCEIWQMRHCWEISRHLVLPFWNIVLVFNHSSWKGKVISKRNIWISLEH